MENSFPGRSSGPALRRFRRGAAYAAALFLAACDGPQSALAPNGPAAAAVADLWWVMLAIATLVSLAVFAALLYALFHRRDFRGERPTLPLTAGAEQKKRDARADESQPETADEQRRRGDDPVDVLLDTTGSDRRSVRWVLAMGVGVSGVILVGTLLFTLTTLGALHGREAPPDLTIEVTGWQWWWEVHYFDREGRQLFEAANEIHVPVGKRVRVRLRAADVIHSFWVPQLAGKLDMIPGRTNQFWIQADRPGVYRGQCAEYCAGPHALMAFLVIAEPEAEFRAWMARQREPAASPESAAPTHPHGETEAGSGHEHGGNVLRRGREVFLTAGCAECHTVRGTPAGGNVGPDLTHLASRRTLAAVTIPNTKGHLGGWITSPQEIKPGNKMPAVPLEPEALLALLHYLQSLK
ncbi:MAG TPA: cytochrome c oxidase subunit II [Longimicrobiaceae bacterium]|nr:cytochrome c oxidase subunit II [Longimicrobiaceae bacterium]